MSLRPPNVSAPSPDAVDRLADERPAPRLDLDVPRRCCTETLRELARRNWAMDEIAAYCQTEKDVVRTKFEHMRVSTPDGAGPPSGAKVLWYTDPKQAFNNR